MPGHERCEQIYHRLFPYFDRELSAREMAEVRRHIEECPPCGDMFMFEGNILRYVRQKAPREHCPVAALERIVSGFRARVQARLARQ